MNLISHVEIPVANLERAMRFYSHVFAIQFGDITEIHDNRMAFFPFEEGEDGASGALAEGPIYVPTKDGAVVYFGVGDIDAALARAEALGSEVLSQKHRSANAASLRRSRTARATGSRFRPCDIARSSFPADVTKLFITCCHIGLTVVVSRFTHQRERQNLVFA
jgi:predicted enzyme related to lactoylglutathione lyase